MKKIIYAIVFALVTSVVVAINMQTTQNQTIDTGYRCSFCKGSGFGPYDRNCLHCNGTGRNASY